jgi:hypothetical protein
MEYLNNIFDSLKLEFILPFAKRVMGSLLDFMNRIIDSRLFRDLFGDFNISFSSDDLDRKYKEFFTKEQRRVFDKNIEDEQFFRKNKDLYKYTESRINGLLKEVKETKKSLEDSYKNFNKRISHGDLKKNLDLTVSLEYPSNLVSPNSLKGINALENSSYTLNNENSFNYQRDKKSLFKEASRFTELADKVLREYNKSRNVKEFITLDRSNPYIKGK